jgi:hypothetical protein
MTDVTPFAIALALVLCAATAAAQEARHEWPGNHASGYKPAWVELHAPAVAGAVASVTFHNEPVHSADEVFPLALDGLVIDVEATWNVDHGPQERIAVTPPPGYAAVPPFVDVSEGRRETLHIYRWEGM